ncbi:ubiquitin carboxyl-terminal hydrolase 24 isoform X4 [Chanodichthys erythropterus]|uniref:ubiquitin carboxyl-terminal hydrolase 24 isoform X4 n=1 Tax=Chanodichthys erythropterus TaxID=933992 RepID=UPI00351F78F5
MMETEEEQHMTTLLCMGFPDPVAIRKALRLAKNDINEAVALLTNESPGLGYGYEPMESGTSPGSGLSGDGENSGRTGTGGFDPPPAYHDVVESERSNDENGNCSGNSMEFPTTNLYELESRVFTDHWSIPYKREESLGKCLIASTCLARLGLADADENCKRFIDRCMPEAFKKLLTSSAVHKWGTEIHEGIYNMLMLLVDLVAERVKQDPIPIGLMGVLTMAFNPDNEYHFKNRMKACQRNWAEVFGEDSMFAVSPSSSYQKEPHGWLVDLVNRFGEMGGFTAIQCKLNQEEIEIGCVSALVQPLGVCAEYLNSGLVQPMLDPVIHKMITYVQNLEEKDLKDKRLVSIPELLSAIKLLCMRFQRELVNVVDDLRLDILLRMLKTPHFSAKMNSLKEVTKLIEESTVSKTVKNAIDTDRLLDWLVENSVLSIALEGNIDQAQYCDRIKGIIELLGSKLSLDELSKIWKIQAGQSSTVIENIHTIIAAAAVKFNFDQLSHLFFLIQKSWEVESDRVRQKLLSLIGRIGREARSEATTGKVLEVLWELAHLPTLPTTLVQQALEEHLTILSDAYAVKETVKRNYIIKCIEDIKKLTMNRDQKLLNQLGFSDEQSLTVKSSGTGTPSGSSADSSASASSSSSGVFNSAYALEQEKSLPGVVMALVCNVFEMLYQLANLEEPRITLRVRKLLLLIPTDPEVQDALDNFVPKESSVWSHQKTLFTLGSGSQASKSPSLSSKQQHQQSAASILESLFRSSAPGMSTFRVLYNLEVLSSKLMPTSDDEMAKTSVKSFCENFLKAGGLSLVVNVMQRDSIPSEVDYETRQGVYSICLQLARFLLVGQAMPSILDEELSKDGLDTLSSRPFRNAGRQSGRQLSVCGTPEKSSYRQVSMSDRSSIRVEEIIPAARVAIQTMEVGDFTSTVACFMRLTWAAAAGRLDLVGNSQPIRETTNSLLPLGVRSRVSSTGSNCSSGSEGEITTLQAGICVKQLCVSIKDTIIAREALSLLVTCLQLRSQQLSSFYSLPSVNDFIIDILLGSSSGEIRRVACDQLYTLSQSDTSAYPDLQKPNLFLLKVVLTAQLPLWSPTSIMRGINQRLLSQCTEYFDLRCQLLDDLTTSEMEQLQIGPAAMLEDEISWLDNFEPTWTNELETSEADNILLAGHLRLIKTLLSLCGSEKEQFGPSLIQQLLDDFLFRASRIILNSDSSSSTTASIHDFHPKCSTVSSRLAAYEVLVMLADSSLTNLQLITKELLSMHHQSDPSLTKEFDYLPPVDSRSVSGFVGLKNGGATCYMNAVFQQLYMQPGLPEAVLSIEDDTENPEESVFCQVQSLFGHLMESKLQYYVPENFWKIFKMWNKELYVREQQDAYEFFTSLVDQLDEHLKKIGREQIFKNTFQGIFSDQKICKDCPHRYEREETFMALNLGVTSCQSLEISLDQFVRGEVLDGSNAYYCEKCKEKRTTVKRTCIKSLPSVLVIHLMRFGFDWESGRSIKYDEQIRFPWVLNMEPYTVSGMARQDSSADHGENGRGGEAGSGGSPRKKVTISENYELVGVVVHSGQAHAGHYYSFIKDRRGSARGRWYKFNDNVVEEFDMNDETLEYECFGGEYRPKVYDQSNPYPDVRRRYWNAYMLFYQRISDQNSPVLPKKSRVSIMRQEAEDLSLSAPSSPEISPQSSPRPPRANNDRLSLLTRLVKKGEKKGLFVEKMPARIFQMVRDENLKFMKNRDVYNGDYFSFTLSLASVNATKLKHPSYQAMAKTSLQLAVQFLFHTYLRTKKKLRVDTEEWIATVEVLLSKSSEACQWMVQYLVAPEGREIIKICLLECSVREVRVVVATILEKTLESALYFHDTGLDCLLDMLLSLLDKDVPDNCKNCSQYFSLFSNFAQRGCGPCQLLLKHSAYRRMLVFLLGANRQNNQHRRWSSAQAREFLHLHNTLALIVLHTDLTSQRTEAQGVFKHASSGLVAPSSPLLPLHSDINTLLFKAEGQVYLMEVMFAMRELSGPLSFLIEMITYCSFCNEPFSLGVLHLLKNHLETAPPHELKNVFQMLLEILMVEDPLQSQRLKYAFETEKGLLALMHQSNNVDSSRCYQCVKFLVTLAQKCSPAKDYFKELSGHWSWAVQWLQKKMSEHYWTPQSNVSNETSTAKTFQRTISAQDTLAYATALLNEKEQSGSSNGSDGSPANENSDRSLRQGSESPMMLGDSRSDLEDVDP